MRRLTYIIPLILLLIMGVLLWNKIGRDPNVLNNTLVDQAVPAIEQPNLFDSQRLIQTEQLPKRPYLLNVWASWCPTCLQEHPFLVLLAQQGVWMVGMNYQDNPQDAITFLLEHGNPFQLVFTDEVGHVAIDLGLTGTPETYIVDSQGIIRQHIVGELTPALWQKQVKPCYERLVAGKSCHE